MNTVYMNSLAMNVYGNLPEVGKKAPNFHLVAQDLSEVTLDSFKGSRLVLNIFPSLDTAVCAASVRKFNERVAKMENTKVVCVSMDLPFAATRFCTANGIENVSTASGFRSRFGDEYGVRIEDGPLKDLYARAVVIIDENGIVKGISMREQITEEPDYDFVEAALKD